MSPCSCTVCFVQKQSCLFAFTGENVLMMVEISSLSCIQVCAVDSFNAFAWKTVVLIDIIKNVLTYFNLSSVLSSIWGMNSFLKTWGLKVVIFIAPWKKNLPCCITLQSVCIVWRLWTVFGVHRLLGEVKLKLIFPFGFKDLFTGFWQYVLKRCLGLK